MDRLVQLQDVDRLIHGDVLVCCFKGVFKLRQNFLQWQLNPLVKAHLMLYFKIVCSDLYFGCENAS